MALGTALISGCSTEHPRENTVQSIPQERYVPEETMQPGTTYEVGYYIVQRGDTIAKICMRFGITVKDFEINNPDVNPKRLKVGQSVKIYRRATDNEAR